MTYRIKVLIMTLQKCQTRPMAAISPTVDNNLSSILCITLNIFSFVTHTWHFLLATSYRKVSAINTLWMGDADLRLYITTVQDGWCKSAFLTRAWFPRNIYLVTQYMEPVSEWSCWWMFTETWPHSELMICDKYREQTALYFPLLLCSAFSQHSDFNHDGNR
jgi:hypothetical protein